MFGADNIHTVIVPIVKDLASGTYPVFSHRQGGDDDERQGHPGQHAGGRDGELLLARPAEPRHRRRRHRLGGRQHRRHDRRGHVDRLGRPDARSLSRIVPAAAKIAAGEVVGVVYAETGTADPTGVVIKIDYVTAWAESQTREGEA